jgi:hypothetical protein
MLREWIDLIPAGTHCWNNVESTMKLGLDVDATLIQHLFNTVCLLGLVNKGCLLLELMTHCTLKLKKRLTADVIGLRKMLFPDLTFDMSSGPCPPSCFSDLWFLLVYQDCSLFDISAILRTDDTNKKIDAWIDIFFLTYFHCKLYK